MSNSTSFTDEERASAAYEAEKQVAKTLRSYPDLIKRSKISGWKLEKMRECIVVEILI